MPTFVQTPHPTPFGFYDADVAFQSEADGMVTFVKRSIGDDVLAVELTKKIIWCEFENACLTYSQIINEMQITSQLVNVLGLPTGSDMTNKYPRQTLDFLIRQAEPYASEASVGGSYDAELGYIDLQNGQQDYNIYEDIKVAVSGTFGANPGDNLWLSVPSGSRGKMRLIEVFHFEPYAAQNFLLNASNITNFLATNFNYESYVNSTVFYVLPVFEDVLRRGMLETAMRVRRSNYSWDIIGSQLRIYPIPMSEFSLGRLYVKVFTGTQNPFDPSSIHVSGSFGGDDSIYGISGPSNVPLSNIPYSTITSPGRNWIRQYCLALCKEVLGLIRSKMKTIPIPNADLQLNGEDLVSQGREDQEKLKQQLRDWLANLTNQKLAEQQAALAASVQTQLKFVPTPNGHAITIG